MESLRIQTDDVLQRVEQNRFKEERLREPYLAAFRATLEEIKLRQIENSLDEEFAGNPITRFSERMARSGRETVRFERFLIRSGFYAQISSDDPLGQPSEGL